MSNSTISTGKETSIVTMFVEALIKNNDGDLKKALDEAAKKREELSQATIMYDAQTPSHLRKALEKGNAEYERVMAERYDEGKKKDRHYELAKEVYMELSRRYKKQWLKERKQTV